MRFLSMCAMSEYRELLIGCGHSREKRIIPTLERPRSCNDGVWCNLTTLDNNPRCLPDVLYDLRDLANGFGGTERFPFGSNSFDELHAYEVLEHVGSQGDHEAFFAQFAEFWRVLKPGGYFCATVPHWKSIWAFGDPGHTRVISSASLVFLDREEYRKQLGITAMSDYRNSLGDTNFKRVNERRVGELFEFVLRAEK